MTTPAGKTKGWITEHREALLGAGLISGIAGIAIGAGVFLVGGPVWASICGIGSFVVVGVLLTHSILSENLDPPTEGEVDEEGFRHGRWLWKSDDGQLLREKNYNHGVKHGPHVSWLENGEKEEEKGYRNGKLHGTWTIWYENGNKAEEDAYKDGRLQGPYLRWYENGQGKQECCYHDDDLPHGEWATWHANGKQRLEARFEYGTPTGVWTEWDSAGELLCQREFKAGIQLGTGRRYFHDFTNPKTTSGNTFLLTGVLAILVCGTFWQVPPLSIAFDIFVVILIHELGHFLAAKLAGIPISHFVIGAGPKIWGVHYGQTAYELRLFPVMGHVKAYDLRRQDFECMCAAENRADSEMSSSVIPDDPIRSAIEYVSRSKRLAFLLAGVTSNFTTVLVIAFAGWMVKHPESSLLEIVSGTLGAIWAVTPVIGNSKEFISGLSVLLGTGLTLGSIGMISLVVACLNLLPIPPLDGFHVVRVMIAMVIRREIPERLLLPLQAAGVCLVIALFTVEGVFFAGRLVTGIGRAVEQWQTPPIVGQPESIHVLDDSVKLSLKDGVRKVPSSDGTKLLAVVMKVDGEPTLMTKGYVVLAQPKGTEYTPLGVLFENLGAKRIFHDIRRAHRVELRQFQDGMKMSVGVGEEGYFMYTLLEPYVTLLYEVSVNEEKFELRYDGTSFPLKPDQTR